MREGNLQRSIIEEYTSSEEADEAIDNNVELDFCTTTCKLLVRQLKKFEANAVPWTITRLI
jgi:hypothetical protein